MRIAGFIPSRLNSQRVNRKNIRLLGGVPLINYSLEALNSVPAIGENVIFASEPSICDFVREGLRYRYVKRPDYLDTQEAKVQDFVGEFISAVPSDIVVLLHITAPFIKPATIAECVDAVASGRHESAFAALEMRKFAWFEGKPLNYSLDRPVPRTQDLTPVYVEQSGLYVFSTRFFAERRCRISPDAYMKIVDPLEGHDIDTNEDFELAEMMLPYIKGHR